MNDWKKPPFKKPWVYIKLAGICLTVIPILICLIHSAWFANKYSETAPRPLILDAQIVAVREDHSDDVSSYDAIMRYVYEGVAYEAVYETFSIESDAYALLGSWVTAQVDPAEPADTLQSYREKAMSSIMASGLFALILMFFLCFPHRKSYVSTYGWRMEMVKKDIMLRQPDPIAALLIWVAAFIVVVALCPEAYLFGDFPFFILLLPAVYSAIGIWWLARFVLDRRLIREDKITLSSVICVGKRMQKDSDGDKQYYLTFSNGKCTYKCHVPKSLYDKMTDGTAVDAAYLGQRKKPVLHYSVLGEDVF